MFNDTTANDNKPSLLKEIVTFKIFNRTDTTGLVANIAAACGTTLIINGLIFGLGWNSTPNNNSPSALTPPGYLVGIVREFLFAGMGTARWLLLHSGNPRLNGYTWLVVGLAAFCLVYPFYTLAPGSNLAGLIGNIGTILVALFVAWKIRKASGPAAALVFLIIPWVSFASISVIQNLQS